MKIELWLTGKTREAWISGGVDEYLQRCRRFGISVTTRIIAESQHKAAESAKKDESARILAGMDKMPRIYTILLDEKGPQLSSVAFAKLIDQLQTRGHSTIRFITGGAFGVDDSVREKADYILSLSAMTFPHQLVRIIFAEQLYRAFTILRGEGYHHE